jgi:hypothetical protein
MNALYCMLSTKDTLAKSSIKQREDHLHFNMAKERAASVVLNRHHFQMRAFLVEGSHLSEELAS